MSYPFGVAQLFARRPGLTENRVRRVVDLIAPPPVVERSQRVQVFSPPRRAKVEVQEAFLQRNVEIVLPLPPEFSRRVLEVRPPDQRRRPRAPENRVARSLEIIVPLEIPTRVASHAPPPRPRAPLVLNAVPSRVPDVVLPLEYRRGVIRGGHSLRVPDYSGVRA